VVFDLKRVMGDQRDADLARVIFNSIVGAVSGLSLQPAASRSSSPSTRRA
jgi:hypothetical protein